MVYNAKTLEVLHALTEQGKENYQQFLEDEGTKILYKAQHPIKWFINEVADRFKCIFSK